MTDGLLARDSTHEVSLAPDDPQLVVKRFVSGAHRAAAREWRALQLLREYAPGLAPEPIRAELSADPPVVVMSRLPGEAMRDRPLTTARLDALGESLDRLHACVPQGVLERLAPAGSGPTAGT